MHNPLDIIVIHGLVPQVSQGGESSVQWTASQIMDRRQTLLYIQVKVGPYY